MVQKITKKDIEPTLSALHLTLQWKKEVKKVAEQEMKEISKSFLKAFMEHPVT